MLKICINFNINHCIKAAIVLTRGQGKKVKARGHCYKTQCQL